MGLVKITIHLGHGDQNCSMLPIHPPNEREGICTSLFTQEDFRVYVYLKTEQHAVYHERKVCFDDNPCRGKKIVMEVMHLDFL